MKQNRTENLFEVYLVVHEADSCRYISDSCRYISDSCTCRYMLHVYTLTSLKQSEPTTGRPVLRAYISRLNVHGVHMQQVVKCKIK